MNQIGSKSAPRRAKTPSGPNEKKAEMNVPISSASLPVEGPEPPKEPNPPEIFNQIFSIMAEDNPLAKRTELSNLVGALIRQTMKGFDVSEKYNWLIIHDHLKMTRADADKIYTAINKFQVKKEIAVILTSGGGEIEPAYLISKLCRESTTSKFVIVVPRRAKSAATLICCGADEIYMGQMSELGPIDPQFGNLPALGLKNAVQHLAELASSSPKASSMFAQYLSASLRLENLGYYERVAESATQYAERLLKKRVLPLGGNPKDVAHKLVYDYMDHKFVIDRSEAESIFGSEMIKGRSPSNEYNMGNAVYEWISLLDSTFEDFGYDFYFYGSPDSECHLLKKAK